jgi:short-subunit dehydrogenase
MILVAKKAAAMMVKQGHGHIIFTSSLAGYIYLPTWSVYCASKWGITTFANVLRQEVTKHGVQVTTVHPGPVQTEFWDPKKAMSILKKLKAVCQLFQSKMFPKPFTTSLTLIRKNFLPS